MVYTFSTINDSKEDKIVKDIKIQAKKGAVTFSDMVIKALIKTYGLQRKGNTTGFPTCK